MVLLFFFKQKTAYEMRISDWSSDVCSSDLHREDLSSLRPHILADRVEQAVREPRLALVEKGFGDIDIFADHRTHRHIAARDQFIVAGAPDRFHRAVEPVHAPAAREPRADRLVDLFGARPRALYDLIHIRTSVGGGKGLSVRVGH